MDGIYELFLYALETQFLKKTLLFVCFFFSCIEDCWYKPPKIKGFRQLG